MSKFIGRNPLPPIVGTNDVLAWDGTEFRPTRSVNVNPLFSSISAAALALAIGTGISDSNAIGFLPSTATAGSEALTMYVGGVAGQVWTRNGAAVDVSGLGALTAVSLKATGLTTSGGVVFNSAAGLLQNSAALTYTSASQTLAVGDGTAAPAFALNGAAGNARTFSWQTGGVNRWIMQATNTAEGGADAGSNWALLARTDAGAVIDTPISITRAAGGAMTFTRQALGQSGTAALPAWSFSADPDCGFFRSGTNTVSLALNGLEVDRKDTTSNIISRNASVALGTAPITGLSSTAVWHGVDATQNILTQRAYGSNNTYRFSRANGTAAALTALASADVIIQFEVNGYEAVTPAFTGTTYYYKISASEAWTNVANGFRHDWSTTANGATSSAATRMRLDQDGNLLLGTTTNGMTAGGSLAIAQDLAHRGSNLGVFNTSPIAKKTGYGTPTGNSYQASFAAGSITLPNLAAQVAQLILDLKAYGLIGA